MKRLVYHLEVNEDILTLPYFVLDVKCKVGFKGGCKEHKTLKIKKLSDKKYSVKTCFEQCKLNNIKHSMDLDGNFECDGFFIGTKDSFCHLYKSGCTKDAGKPYTYYPIENCEGKQGF